MAIGPDVQRQSKRVAVHLLRKMLLPASVLLLAGCAAKHATVLSGDNAYEMQSSILTLAEKLPPARRDEFNEAVATIVFQATDRRLAYDGDRLTPQAIQMLKGRTVSQVIETAKTIRSAQKL